MSGSGKNLAVVVIFGKRILFFIYFYFFPWYNKLVFLFVFLCLFYFNNHPIVSWFRFICALHIWISFYFRENIVFTEELHKPLLTLVFLKGRYTFLKSFISTFILSLMPITCSDIKNFVFHIFGNCCPRLNFAVLLRISDGKYQNILLTPICANLILHASVLWKWHFQPFSVILDQMFSPNIREIFFKISEKS